MNVALFSMSDANEIKNLLVIHLIHSDGISDLFEN